MKKAIIMVSVFLLSLTLFSTKIEIINVGGLFALSGPAQVIGIPSEKVAKYLVDEFNNTHKNIKIKLWIADTKSNPAEAVQALKRLIQKHKIVAIIGPTTTGSCMACLGTVNKFKIPMIACVGGTVAVEPVEKRKWVFKTPQKSITAIKKIYGFLFKKNLSKVVILYSDDKFGQEGLTYLEKLAPEFKIKILKTYPFNRKDIDFKIIVSKALKEKPEALIVWTIGPAGSNITKNYKELGGKSLLILCHGEPTPNFLKGAGKAAEGVIMPSTKVMVADELPNSDPQKKLLLKFIDIYENKQKLGKVSTHSGYAWDATKILLLAIEKGARKPAEIRDTIENTKNYIGVSGIYNMSPKDHCGLDIDSLVMVIVKNGKFHLLEK